MSGSPVSVSLSDTPVSACGVLVFSFDWSASSSSELGLACFEWRCLWWGVSYESSFMAFSVVSSARHNKNGSFVKKC